MYSDERNKWPYAEHTNSDRNVRRRYIYEQISPDKKEAMLLKRRARELERQKWNSSKKLTVDPHEKVMYQCHPTIQKDATLTITEVSSANDKAASNHGVNTFSTSFDKGKNAASPISVFEKGSTSCTSKGQENVFHAVTGKGYRTWTRRQKRNVIGRVVTCHPTEGERYYLRLLLMNVRGPKSYEDLRTVNDVPYSTFRESAEKRGLLYCNNSLIECMSEAVSYQMPYSLRRLFATLLVYCNPGDPKKLWEMFEDSMSDDFRHFSAFEEKGVRHRVLKHINDILHSTGHDINEYKLIPEKIRASETAKDAKDVHFERNIIVSEQDLLLPKRLNAQQLHSYNTIIDRVFSGKKGAFFIDGPGGTVTLLHHSWSQARKKEVGLLSIHA